MPRKCIDIPDAEFLAAVDTAIAARSERTGLQCIWANRWEVALVLAGHPEAVGTPDAPEPVGYPENLVRAKARKLIRRKLLSGCACGCRGDFEVTAQGRLLLATAALAAPSALS